MLIAEVYYRAFYARPSMEASSAVDSVSLDRPISLPLPNALLSAGMRSLSRRGRKAWPAGCSGAEAQACGAEGWAVWSAEVPCWGRSAEGKGLLCDQARLIRHRAHSQGEYWCHAGMAGRPSSELCSELCVDVLV